MASYNRIDDARNQKGLRWLKVASLLLCSAWLVSCGTNPVTPVSSDARLRGFNLLQTSRVSLSSNESALSMRNMSMVGANSVVLVPFLRQRGKGAQGLGYSDAVTDRQLISAIRKARELGLRVILKPQILVDGGWAGSITFTDRRNEARWFGRYQQLLLHYAAIAQREGVESLVIGTELAGLERSDGWINLIKAVRAKYHGLLTYAAHGVDGVKRFSSWSHLDVVSVTLYPDLGSGDEVLVKLRIEQSLAELQSATTHIERPLWILELGMPSAKGSLERPWDWMRLKKIKDADPKVQAMVINYWLAAAEEKKITGMFIWCWYSDPTAGGEHDVDYTVQNKPAEATIRCRWSGGCKSTTELTECCAS